MAKKKHDEPMRVVTFRVPPSIYEELSATASSRGIDLSSLLNQIVTDALPAIRAANERARRRAEAASLLIPEEHLELTWAALASGRQTPLDSSFKDILRVMRESLAMFPPIDPSLEQQILLSAARAVIKERKSFRFPEEGPAEKWPGIWAFGQTGLNSFGKGFMFLNNDDVTDEEWQRVSEALAQLRAERSTREGHERKK